MVVNPLLNSISAAISQQSTPVSLRSASTAPVTDSATTSVPSVSDSAPSQPLLQSASLLAASANFAQLGSLLQVAQSGTQQISSILQQLQSLAEQVPQSEDLSGIESEFQQVLAQIDQTASDTKFGGNNLLDGTFSSTTPTSDTALSLPNLSVSGLFGSNPPSVASQQSASAANTALAQALATVDNTGNTIDNVQAQLGFASASIDTAIANNTAAASTLSETDLASGAVPDGIAKFLSKSSTSAQAQTGNLPDSLLALLRG